jgi:hypothetical protein
MRLTLRRTLPVCAALCVILASAAPAYAEPATRRLRPAKSPVRIEQRIELYSPRVRRSTIMYLRLRLLELREAGLDRARAAIERRLSIDDLLAQPDRPVPSERDSREPRPHQSPEPPPF